MNDKKDEFKECIAREFEEIAREEEEFLENDTSLVVPEGTKEAVLARVREQIRAYEMEQTRKETEEVINHLSEEDREALELGRKMLKAGIGQNDPEEPSGKKVRRKKKPLKMYLALAAVIGGSITNLVLIIGMLMWPVITRIVRGEVLVTKQNEYILAAKALGFNTFEIIIHHIIPNIISAILVSSTLCIAQGILMEATLSFLGLGVNPPTPSWGNMLVAAQNMSVLSHKWWMWIPAGMSVVLIVLSVNFVGDGLRDALDVEKSV